MPKRGTPEYYAMGLIDQIVVQGEDSLLYKEVVKDKGYTSNLSGGINYLGNMFNYNGPMLFAADFIYDEKYDEKEVLKSIDKVVEQIQTKGVTQADIDRSIVKLRSTFYDQLTQFGGFGRADLLAAFALFDDDPNKINQIEAEFRKVTPKLIQETAKEYLRDTNRTVIFLKTAKQDSQTKDAKAEGGSK